MKSSATEKLASIVSHLGGPEISPLEIDWALDLPAGKRLIEWLVDQLDEDVETDTVDDGDSGRLYRAALKDIALDRQELSLYVFRLGTAMLYISNVCADRLKEAETLGPVNSSLLGAKDYTLPSEIR